jgi:hypothetical protein
MLPALLFRPQERRNFQIRSFQMKAISLIALAAASLMCLPADRVLAQASTDTPAAAPSPAPPAPAASPAPADAGRKTAAPKKKSRQMTRQQEIDRSIESGTVPSRYRSQVPKEYQQYIPFDKR